jgi:hypothetical protein
LESNEPHGLTPLSRITLLLVIGLHVLSRVGCGCVLSRQQHRVNVMRQNTVYKGF